MSLAAKGSRPITVDGEAYRWVLSPDSGYNVIVVQAAAGNGAKLLVYVSYSNIRYVGADADGRIAVTPALVTSIIRQALQNGWRPDELGGDFTCDLESDESIVPRVAP